MSATSVGREAESNVAEYLKKHGYKLVEQNWRTKFCEIDLIMTKDGVVYFIEVKYRKTDTYGTGLEYITPKKLKQMKFAAEMWLANSDWDGESTLAAAELDSTGDLIELVELL
jgi:uncharacterized protein (TIGR00252 family)